MKIEINGFLVRSSLAAIFLISVLCFFAWRIWFDPDTEFLPPVIGADWLLHPNQQVKHFQHGRPSDDVVFRRVFRVSDSSPSGRMQIKAMTEHRLTVNGNEIIAPPRNWKRYTAYDLSPYLRHGENEIIVWVSNPTGFPIFLAKGEAAGIDLRTSVDSGWQVSKSGSKEWVAPVISRFKEPEKPTVGMAILTAAYALLIFVSLFLPEREEANPDLPGSVYWSGVFLILGSAAFLYFRNAAFYPVNRGIDWAGHADYVVHFTQHLRPPLAFEGWEMFQPPFYYVIASLLYRMTETFRICQLLTAAFGWMNVVLAFLTLRLILPRERFIHLSVLPLIAFMPMQVYMSPLLTNEVPAAAMISLSLYLGLRWLDQPRPRLWRYCLLGVVMGLALLTKYTAAFVVATILTAYLYRTWRSKMRILHFGVMAVLVVVISGWFYARNLVYFGDPLVGNWDEQTGFHYEQNPGYRTLEFYTRFGSSIYTREISNNIWTTFWDGFHSSMWAEPHFFVARRDQPCQIALMRSTTFLALFPLTMMCVGLWRAIVRFIRDGSEKIGMLVMLTAMSLASALSFTMDIPFYSTVKAFFMLSLMGPIAVSIALGMDRVIPRIGFFRWLIPALSLCIAVLSFITYYLPAW